MIFLSVLVRCEGCKVDKCSREYERAMDTQDIRNPEPSAEFCQVARDYSACLRGTARSCRGNLNYHSTMSTLGRMANEFNCPRLLTNATSAGHVPLPSSSAAPPRTTSTAAPRRQCTYQGRHRFRHCGLFGDPHLKTFKNEYQTCRVRGAWPLIDNPYLGVQVTNEPVVEGSPATATTKVSASSSDRNLTRRGCAQFSCFRHVPTAKELAAFVGTLYIFFAGVWCKIYTTFWESVVPILSIFCFF